MQSILFSILIILWLIGTVVRSYRQARFYQIEEYMSLRYARWVFKQRERLIPTRAIVACSVGILFALVGDSIPNEVSFQPYIVGAIATLIAIYPPSEGEIKKKFNRTQRATRLLGGAFLIATIAFLLLAIIANNFGDSDRIRAVSLMLGGLGLFLLAPLWLILGNLLMTPIEAFLRRRFITQAKEVLAAIQPKVIGITGSYGKTTTKNFLRDILNGRYKTYATPKSYNTMMGVSMAINQDLANDYSVEYFISEMGAYIEGEIARICDLTPPDISIVVEVGPQHLERFGSIENIAKAKYEIIQRLPKHGLGVFNWDNPYVREMYERGYPDHRIAVSREVDPTNPPANAPRFIASDVVETLQGLAFTVTDLETNQQERFETMVVGVHNVTNLLIATAVAVNEGMSLRDVAMRVRVLQPAESRLVRQTTDSGITIINDAYSANPVGIVSALQVLGLYQTGRRLVITPGMVELADLQETENGKLGAIAAQYATDIILVGEQQTASIKAGALAAGFPSDRLITVSTLSEAVTWYKQKLGAGDTVLFLNDLPDTY